MPISQGDRNRKAAALFFALRPTDLGARVIASVAGTGTGYSFCAITLTAWFRSEGGRDALVASGTDSDRRIIAYLDLLQQNPAPPRYPGVPGMSGMLTRANEAVAFGKLNPKQAAQQFIGEVSARL